MLFFAEWIYVCLIIVKLFRNP